MLPKFSPKGRPFQNMRISKGKNILPKPDQALKLELEVKDALLTCFQNIVLLPSFCFIWEELELSANIYQVVSLLHSNFSSQRELKLSILSTSQSSINTPAF